MSRVMLIAADHPLPLCDRQTDRTYTVTVCAQSMSVTAPAGFRVGEHSYYRGAVDELGYSIKPYPYELDLEAQEADLADLKRYLQEHFAPGEEAELFNLWVGSDELNHPIHYRGRLADFDMDTLNQLLEPPHKNGGIGQCRMTVVIGWQNPPEKE